MLKNIFFKEIAEAIKDVYLPILPQIKGILLGGPGPTKYDFYNENYILDYIKQKIIAVKDISYTDESGLTELLNSSQDLLKNEEFMREKIEMNSFLEMLARNPEKVDYGFDVVMKRLQEARVEKLLVSEALDGEKLNDLIEASKIGSPEIIMVSTEIPEGIQLRELGKVGCILRY